MTTILHNYKHIKRYLNFRYAHVKQFKIVNVSLTRGITIHATANANAWHILHTYITQKK